jgi:hypothetical protein
MLVALLIQYTVGGGGVGGGGWGVGYKSDFKDCCSNQKLNDRQKESQMIVITVFVA